MSDDSSIEVTDRPENATQLADLIESLTVFDHDGDMGGYGKSADAMWEAAVAAFNYVARKVGATGFQASWAAMKFYAEAMSVDGPFMVLKIEDALYPQYDLPRRVVDFIEEQRPWLADQAAKKLADSHDHAAPRVVDHWRALANHPATEGDPHA